MLFQFVLAVRTRMVGLEDFCRNDPPPKKKKKKDLCQLIVNSRSNFMNKNQFIIWL